MTKLITAIALAIGALAPPAAAQSVAGSFAQGRTHFVATAVGAFYRRTNIDGLADLDSVGARAGAYVRAGGNAYIGIGAVHESYLDCESNVYRKCDSTYAEISLTFAF